MAAIELIILGKHKTDFKWRLEEGCEQCLSGPYKKWGCPLPEQSYGKLEPSTYNTQNEGAIMDYGGCPVPMSEKALPLVHFLFDILETNILPRSGGWAKQTPYFMKIWELFKIGKSICETERNLLLKAK